VHLLWPENGCFHRSHGSFLPSHEQILRRELTVRLLRFFSWLQLKLQKFVAYTYVNPLPSRVLVNQPMAVIDTPFSIAITIKPRILS